MTNAFDLCSVHLGATNIAGFAFKRDAAKFAKDHGWPPNASRAYNRFNTFWIVCQTIGEDRTTSRPQDADCARHDGPGDNP